ncbi:Cysteine-rich VLP domain-containing protein, partial [Dysosmobacter welbionis]
GDSAGQAHHRPAKLRPHLERRAGWYVERLHRRRRAGSRGTETGIEREDKGSETKGPGGPMAPGL